jgi:hypothetical protein
MVLKGIAASIERAQMDRFLLTAPDHFFNLER